MIIFKNLSIIFLNSKQFSFLFFKFSSIWFNLSLKTLVMRLVRFSICFIWLIKILIFSTPIHYSIWKNYLNNIYISIIINHYPSLIFNQHLHFNLNSIIFYIKVLQIYPIMSTQDAKFFNFSIHKHLSVKMLLVY